MTWMSTRSASTLLARRVTLMKLEGRVPVMRVTRNLSALSLDLSLLERERPALSANAFLSPLRSAEGICLVPAARCPAPVAPTPAPAARGRGICGGATTTRRPTPRPRGGHALARGQNRQRGGDRGRARLRSRRTSEMPMDKEGSLSDRLCFFHTGLPLRIIPSMVEEKTTHGLTQAFL